MRRAGRTLEVHDRRLLVWTLLIFLGLLLAWSGRASAALPDSRAYEQVSPVEKGGGEVLGINGIASEAGVVQAAPDGGAITWLSYTAFANPQGAPFSNQYISRRGAGGWSTQNITAPTHDGEYALPGQGGPYKAFSTDLDSALMYGGALPLPPGLPSGYSNYHLRNNETGAFQSLLTSLPHGNGEEILTPGQFNNPPMEVVSASPDLQHVAVRTPGVLTEGATYSGKENLYEWSKADAQFHSINILPGVTNGETTPEAIFGLTSFEKGVISEDGSRVFWANNFSTAEPQLFVRENPEQPQSPLDVKGQCEVESDACTVQIDVSHGEGGSGKGEFRTASADGEKVFFTDREKLTPESTAGGFHSREDLYEYDTQDHKLVDLTIDHNPDDVEGASVQGVLDASNNGSYVYFVAGGALPQAGENEQGQHPVSGGMNLYVSHEGALRYISTLSEANDSNDWREETYDRTARVSGDGTHAMFQSTNSLTGYDNAGFSEVYLYDAATSHLSCVSCNPSGARATGPSSIPAGTGFHINAAIYQSRVLSEGLPDGGSRVFFDSSDALVSQDTNGRQDVYEWEADGTGSCRSEAQNGGCVSLLSGGTYSSDSSFVDASEDGSNVFFITGQQLLGSDKDELADLYDAREGGGIAEAPAAPVCSGTGCQGVPPAPPIFATPSTVTFNGVGNFAAPAAKPVVKAKAKGKARVKACKRGFARKHGKCVRKSTAKGKKS